MRTNSRTWLAGTAALALGLGCSREPATGANTGASTGTSTAGGAGAGVGPATQPVGLDAGGAFPLSGNLRGIPRPIPAGNIQIVFSCFHSNMPFGEGSQSSSVLIDLARGTMDATTSVTERDQPIDGPDDPKARPRITRNQIQLRADRVLDLRRKLDALLAGGPYRCEYPVSEGISCQLALQLEGQAPFFEVDKAATHEADAASALVLELGPGPQR